MDPNDIAAGDDAVDLDLLELKRMLAERDDATREFQRVKIAILEAQCSKRA